MIELKGGKDGERGRRYDLIPTIAPPLPAYYSPIVKRKSAVMIWKAQKSGVDCGGGKKASDGARSSYSLCCPASANLILPAL